jgi:hypothetical protein
MDQLGLLHLTGHNSQRLGSVLDLGHRHAFHCCTRHCHVLSPKRGLGSTPFSYFFAPSGAGPTLPWGRPDHLSIFGQKCPFPQKTLDKTAALTLSVGSIRSPGATQPFATEPCVEEGVSEAYRWSAAVLLRPFARPRRPFLVAAGRQKHYHISYDVIGGNRMNEGLKGLSHCWAAMSRPSAFHAAIRPKTIFSLPPTP